MQQLAGANLAAARDDSAVAARGALDTVEPIVDGFRRVGTGLRWFLLLVGGILAVCATVVAGAVASAAGPPRVTLPSTPMSDADAAFVTQRAELGLQLYPGDVPGLIVGIWDPVKGVYRNAFGVADTTTGRKPTTADAFRIGSVTKTFTATLILQLVAEGKLSLDGQVRRYAPGLAKRFPGIGSRTVRQLLAMQSGLPEYADRMVAEATKRPEWTTKVWMPEQLIRFALRSGPVSPAGASPGVYTNTNFVVLGEVLRAVTGKTLPELVSTRITKPLGLGRTFYPKLVDTALTAPATRGYITAGGAKEIAAAGGAITPVADVTGWSSTWSSSAGMMTSTIDDLARWAASGYGSALLPAKLRAERLKPTQLADGSGYGLGLELYSNDWQGHFGGILGWSTLSLRNTKSGVIVVMSVNACCGSEPASAMAWVMDRIYPGAFS